MRCNLVFGSAFHIVSSFAATLLDFLVVKRARIRKVRLSCFYTHSIGHNLIL